MELERRSRALDEKEQGLLFLEVQLEETSAELERRAMALAMSGPTVTYHSLRLPHFAIHALLCVVCTFVGSRVPRHPFAGLIRNAICCWETEGEAADKLAQL